MNMNYVFFFQFPSNLWLPELTVFVISSSDWIVACASLVIIALFVDLVATVLTAIGLNTQHPERKFIFYRAAMYLMFFAGNEAILHCGCLQSFTRHS